MNWSQIRTLLWLRSRLSWNQWRRRGAFNTIVATLFTISGVMTAAMAGIGGFFLGVHVLGKLAPDMALLAWDSMAGGFLFVWMIGLLVELQRSESIDMGRLLHLPVSMKGVFAVNYVASHLTFSIAVASSASGPMCLVWKGSGSRIIRGWARYLIAAS